jgi:hypothetical protein
VNTISAPTFWRSYTLNAEGGALQFSQLVEEFMPSRSLVKIRDKEFEVRHDSTPRQLRDAYLPEREVDCVVHLARDLDVIFQRIFAHGPVRLVDRCYQEQADLNEEAPSVENLEAEPLMGLTEKTYLRNNNRFQDPYQHEDPRVEPLRFEKGSSEDLAAGITDLFQAFPSIFDKIPEPRVFVYSKFDNTPASANAHLWENGRLWQTGEFFMKLLTQIVFENTPVGCRYASGTEGLARRSQFKRESILIPVIPSRPSLQEVTIARREVESRFNKYGLILNPRMFDQLPIFLKKPDPQRSP